MSSFLDIALQHASLGLYIFPVARDKSTLTAHGFHDASTDLEHIRTWWEKFPGANPGFAPGVSDVAVLDIDHGLTDMDSFIAWRDRNGIPETYTVRSGSRPEFKVHMYFRGAMRDVGIWELDGCSGQVKSLGGYVLAAGSEALHGQKHDKPGAPYEAVAGKLGIFADTPDVIRRLRKPVAATSNNSKVRKTAWNLPVHDGENRTGFLLEQTGAMRNLGCGKDAILARMIELNENADIIADPVEYERLERTAENCAKFPVPEPDPVVVLGRTQTAPEIAPQRESNRPEYPIEVWEGTVVGEFAKLCAHDNNIPRKLFAESFRCVLGAVMGDRISCPVEGGVPRTYTIIIAPKGKGKGTAIRRAVKFFNTRWEGLSTSPGLLSGERDFIWKPQGIGAWNTAASSVPGMARLCKDTEKTVKTSPHIAWGNTLPRILSVHEEMKTFLSTLFIEGGVGSGMEGVICQLWDDVTFNGTATGTREAQYGEMLFSLLCGVTPDDWSDLLSRGDAVGGGLMSRLNLIGSEGGFENVGRMGVPDFTALQASFLPRVCLLANTKTTILPARGADGVIDDWVSTLPEGSERLNVHVLRSALLLAWLRREETITAKIAEDAIRLGQYQVSSHEFYRVAAAESQCARIQAKIVRALDMKGPQAKRELQRGTHSYRYGTDAWSRALDGLIKDRRVGRKEDGTLYLAGD